MKLLLKPFNNLIKFLRKNLLLSLFVIFLLLFGFFQLSIGIFSSSSFTMTNVELVGNNIQLSKQFQNTTILNPKHQGSNIALYSNSANQYCVDNSYSSAVFQSYTSWARDSYLYENSVLGWRITGSNKPLLDNVICSKFIGFQILGSIVQTTPIIPTSQYDTLTLEYNATLNGGTITPILIVNGVEKSLINNELKGTFPVGTNVSVKFTFTGSTSATPQLNNNIILGGSYTNVSSSSSSLSSDPIVSSKTLSTLKATSTKISNVKGSVNKFATYLSNLVYNFVKIILSPFGFVGV